ncbi:MAG: helix-turn-helix domain-containing protein [Cellulosilyticum sp.]|nr:helix-turn-helix domain-containing protein [Cellulosilyticum sp.]
MNESNSVRIYHGTREVRGIIEIQAYINHLERSVFELKKKLREAKILIEQNQKSDDQLNQLTLLLDQANTEIAYYQAMILTHNCGRPGKLSTQDIFEIREMRKKGSTLKVIADQYHISLALVHKVTKDLGKDNRKRQ